MRWLDFAALGAAADRLDELVAVTDGIDRFCTSSRWSLPAQRAFMPAAEPFITESADGIVALMTVVLPDGRRVGVPLEASWGLASPFASARPGALVGQLRRMLESDRAPESLYLSGVSRSGPWFEEVLRGFMGRARFGLGRSCGRRVADLRGGIEPWLASRSPRFRANLRRAARRAEDAGVRFSWHPDIPAEAVPGIFDRMMAVEGRSWKGIAGVGVQEGEARDFYREVALRLAACGELRVLLGRQGDDDVVFVLGGVFKGAFRGLQMSFDDGLRDLSLGNIAQFETMKALAAEGVASYDLGTEMPYKMRWAPEGLETVTLALFPD
ncbi:MAG: GNAT family N-acetyltransferase [bacterium]